MEWYRTSQFDLSESNFGKGVKWSPDGTCLLTCGEDNVLRLFETPFDSIAEMMALGANNKIWKPVLEMTEGETVYDFGWDKSSRNCLTTSRDAPIHLYDAFTGTVKESFRSYDRNDELIAAYSVSYNSDESKIHAGYSGFVSLFDVEKPGRDGFDSLNITSDGGIVSCLASVGNIFCAGSYTGDIVLYDELTLEHTLTMAHIGIDNKTAGVTSVCFSPCGNYLFSGARNQNDVICWDIRKTYAEVYRISRDCHNNQRIGFDIDKSGRYFVSGSQANEFNVVDLCINERPTVFSAKVSDVVNGVCFHPTYPIIAVSTGERKISCKKSKKHQHVSTKIIPQATNKNWKKVSMAREDSDIESSSDDEIISNSFQLFALKQPGWNDVHEFYQKAKSV